MAFSGFFTMLLNAPRCSLLRKEKMKALGVLPYVKLSPPLDSEKASVSIQLYIGDDVKDNGGFFFYGCFSE